MTDTGESIGNSYKTLMPKYSDTAAIQEAFKMYHYGVAGYDGSQSIQGMEGHLSTVNTKISNLQSRPAAMASASSTEPTVIPDPNYGTTIPTVNSVLPDGYIWIDLSQSRTYDVEIKYIIDSTTARTIGLTDSSKSIWMTSTSAKTITIPTNATTAFPIGTAIEIFNNAATGTVTFAGASGVTIVYPSTSSLVLAVNQGGKIVKVATDKWILAKYS